MHYAIACLPLLAALPAAGNPLHTEIEAIRAAKDSLLKDPDNSPLLPADRAQFAGLAYYPIDLDYRLRGEFHIYGRQRQIDVLNTDGTYTPLERYGRFVSAWNGKDFWLEVYRSPETGIAEIFFKDATNGQTTYGGGRYARLTRNPDNTYIIDFNNSYNPYCDYNPAYICPLPPGQNHLSFPIAAGELKYGMDLAE